MGYSSQGQNDLSSAEIGTQREAQSDKISHIDMGDDTVDSLIFHIISPHVRSPVSISHIDIPYQHRIISCHSGKALPASRVTAPEVRRRPAAASPGEQGLTLVHSPAQREQLLHHVIGCLAGVSDKNGSG
jgi:hypothetical protein